MKRHVWYCLALVLLLGALGVVFSFSVVRETVVWKFLWYWFILHNEHTSSQHSEVIPQVIWQKRAKYGDQVIILPQEGEIPLDEYIGTSQQARVQEGRLPSFMIEYPRFSSLLRDAGFVIEAVSGGIPFWLHAYLQGDDMIELPSFPIETKPYAIYAEGEREGVGKEGFRYPCVAYLRSATMNSGVDPRCLQVLINRQGDDLRLYFDAYTGTVLKVSPVASPLEH